MNILFAYFGSFLFKNAYVFKGLLGHKDPVPNHDVTNIVMNVMN
jgi:hypothetical protein